MKIMTKLLLLATLTSQLALAQGGLGGGQALFGGGVPNAGIRVCAPTAGDTVPCNPLASIYTDETLATAKANPFTADSKGNYVFYALPGLYKVQITGRNVAPLTQKMQVSVTTTNGKIAASLLGSGTLDPTFVLQLDANSLPVWGPDPGGSPGGGTTVSVNGANVSTPNFGTSPAASGSNIVCNWQVSGSNVSLQCPYSQTSAGFARGDLVQFLTGKDVVSGYVGISALGDVGIIRNLTIASGGALFLPGSWLMTTVPGPVMSPCGLGISCWGVDSDGFFKFSVNNSAVHPFTGLSVNAVDQTLANLNNTTPVAEAGFINCKFQVTSNNVSTECPDLNLVTAGKGIIYLPFDVPMMPSTATTKIFSAAPNQVAVSQFTLKESATITHLNFSVATASAGQTATMCIYTDDGLTKLVDAGAISCNATGTKTSTFGGVTLTKGSTYKLAWGASDNVCAGLAIAGTNLVTLSNSNGSKRVGTVANALAAGVCPATLGVVTPGNNDLMVGAIEP